MRVVTTLGVMMQRGEFGQARRSQNVPRGETQKVTAKVKDKRYSGIEKT